MADTIKKFDYSTRDYYGFRAEMIKGLQEKIPEYTDTSDTDAGIVVLEMLAKGLDVLSYNVDAYANESCLTTALIRENIITRAREIGYTPMGATPSKFKQLITLRAPQQVDFILPIGTVFKTPTTSEGAVYFETLSEVVIPSGSKGDEKDPVTQKYLHEFDVVHGITIQGELLGSSDDTPNQTFLLKERPVLEDTVTIITYGGDSLSDSGAVQWTRVDSFINSDSSSKHFIVIPQDNYTAKIQFGDGVFGMIPPKISNGIFAYYRIGGGSVGNVSANTITELLYSNALVSSTTNPFSCYEMGTDREPTENIPINAMNHNRIQDRAIIPQDYADLVLRYYGQKVAYSEAFIVATDMSVKVCTIFFKEVQDTMSVEEGNKLIEDITATLQDRQFVGGTFTVSPPQLEAVTIIATLVVKSDYTRDSVKENIIALLTDHFALGNHPFTRSIYLSDLESLVSKSISGVETFRITNLAPKVEIPIGSIPSLSSLTINASGGIVVGGA